METSACVTYSFRANYKNKGKKRVFVPLGNEIVSEFIGLCKQKKVKLCVTKTVKDEAFDNLLKIVNRYFDRAKIFAPPVRQNIYLKIRKRLKELIKYTGNLDVTSNIKEIEKFYKRSAHLKKLVALKQKKSRKSLMPSSKDMKILSEAVELNKTSTVCVISGDGDFLDFKVEIKKEFDLIVVDIMDLRRFAKNLL